MTTLLLLVATLAPVLVTAFAARAGGSAAVARACARSCVTAAIIAIGILLLTGTRSDGIPPGTLDLPALVDVGADRAGALLLVAVLGTGAVVASFSRRSLDDGPRAAEYFALLAAVVSGSALVVLPGGPVPLVLGWLLSGRALTRLVEGWVHSATASAACRRVRRVMRISDVALVAAVVIAVGVAGGDSTVATAAAADELGEGALFGMDAGLVVAVLVVIAGAVRSSLVPFHRWLIGTLYAPTPVSALVHAGFVSGAGLLLIRFAPVFVDADAAVVLALLLAVATIVVGTLASTTRPDAKGALAWSTVAQMAFMVLQCSIGAFAGAVFHIVGHGMYKAALFLGVGDTVSAGLRARRRPEGLVPIPVPARRFAVLAIPTVAVAIGMRLAPTGTDTDERLLLGAFAWISIASAVHGWLETRPRQPLGSVGLALAGGVVAAGAYFGGLRIVKSFIDPSFAALDDDGAIGLAGVIAALVVVGASLLAVTAAGRSARWGATATFWLHRTTKTRPALRLGSVGTVPAPAPATAPSDARRPDAEPAATAAEARHGAATRLAALQAQVERAGSIIGPQWPLASFVAVNPLTGLESGGFEQAAADARRWLRARTYAPLEQFRADHRVGRIRREDLEWAVHERLMDECLRPPIEVGGRRVDRADVILADLLTGPESAPVDLPRTELERRLGTDAGEQLGIDDLVGEWIASWVGQVHGPPAPGRSLIATARRQAVLHARRELGAAAASWLEALDDDPLVILDAALTAAGIGEDARAEEIRGHLACLPGWTALARWRTEWAHPDEALPPLRLVDVAALRAALETAVLLSLAAGGGPGTDGAHARSSACDHVDGPAVLRDRTDAVVEHLGLERGETSAREVSAVLADVPDAVRAAIWLRARERSFDDSVLGLLEQRDAGPRAEPPECQLVFCIDVRSEGLRRRLEALGRDETIGFAGFFGVPMRVRELGWSRAEPRCPVLVSPGITAEEHPRLDRLDPVARSLARSRFAHGVGVAHAETKHVPGAPFSTAELLGWLYGPMASLRTFAPARSALRSGDHAGDSFVQLEETPTEEGLFAAEAVLRTMGLTDRFAPLVVLCGHTSHTTNNPHATALDCGACAGASGATNARAVAGLLNRPDVRRGLVERGIEIPDGTWFLAGVHDTASDEVTLFDVHDAPAEHAQAIDRLRSRLDRASATHAADRARSLPGPPERVRDRGRDWAQVRPEWGLAANAAFVIGPRSITADVDLAGRAFLHSYDAAQDPEGRVLETIMTAPLVVGHWISSQYYFSTVDPDVFGSGDKLLHNPIGTVGVLAGAGGDLRIGLPLQSTHVGDRPYHQPLRLLAVVQADLATIDDIIRRNSVLSTLVGGSWLRIAGRSNPGEPWSTRSPQGTWTTLPTRIESLPTLEIA